MEKKVLYVDTCLLGHRTMYLKSLAENSPRAIALLPEECEIIKCKQVVMASGYDKKRTFVNYLNWINEIEYVIRKYHVDMVHILCGDMLYRYFGIGIKKISVPVVVTYHHMLFDSIRKLSIKSIFRKTTAGIVHTEQLLDCLFKMGISNVHQIQYPVFTESLLYDKNIEKKKLGIPNDIPCIVALGATSYYKGLDILLEACSKVKTAFWLHIAGKEVAFSSEFIKENTKSYNDRITYDLRCLSDEEYFKALAIADIIVLPYRYEFDGASGPMIEAVWYRKFIVGSEHGSMGDVIKRNNLGKTFKTENSDDLAKVLEDVLNKPLIFSKEAEVFRQYLSVDLFLKRNQDVYSLY